MMSYELNVDTTPLRPRARPVC